MTKAEELKYIAEELLPPNNDPSYIVLSDSHGALTRQGVILATWALEAAATGNMPTSDAFYRFADLCVTKHMPAGDFFRQFPNDARALFGMLLEEMVAAMDRVIAGKKPNPSLPINVDKILRRAEERVNDDGIRPRGNLMERWC